MRPGWRRVAERAANPSFPPIEIGNALVAALTRDWRDEVPADLVHEVTRVLETPPGLFRDDTVRRLEELRPLASASGLGQVFFDCAVQLASDGEGGADAPATAAERALATRAARGGHQVEEHYLRRAEARIDGVRSRIDAGISAAPLPELARQLLHGSTHPVGASIKQKGLDDGVTL